MHEREKISKQDIRVDTNYNKTAIPVTHRELTPAEHKRALRLASEETRIQNYHPKLKKQEEEFLKGLDHEIVMHEQSPLLKTPLMHYQLYGVSWMIDREESKVQGGILSDEMGMGKTLQALGLILSRNTAEVTLVVVPVIAISQWIDEMHKHAPGAFNVINYYGTGRTDSFNIDSTKFNVVITTYGTLASDFRRKRRGVLFSFNFYRAIIDEAHVIKSQSTNINTAVSNINAVKRWGLTGTPVQNRVADLYTLVRFLKLDPHSYYFCKRCPCKSYRWLNYDKELWHSKEEIEQMTDPGVIDRNIGSATNGNLPVAPKFKLIPTDKETRQRGFCVCGHFSSMHFGWWNRRITAPVRELGFTVKGPEIFEDLSRITSHLILRRTKALLEKELGLPSKKITVLRNYFTPQEKDFYMSLYRDTRVTFDSYVTQGQLNSNYVHIFDLINRMRQAANHPYLAIKDYNSDVPICGYCNEEADDPIMSACKHIFCREEARSFLLTDSKCPVCKLKVTIDLNQEYNFTIKNKIIHTDTWTSSSKIESLVEELHRMQNEFESPKSLVFSQYVNFLELLRWRLERAGYRCVKIYGSTSIAKRRVAIEQFNTDSRITVFLISLKAGGLALNLTEANRVFLMDLWWNPAVENQAIDRIHRIGQYRSIEITKIIVEDSIESRVLALQDKKQALFESAVDNDSRALEKLSEEDLMFLFS